MNRRNFLAALPASVAVGAALAATDSDVWVVRLKIAAGPAQWEVTDAKTGEQVGRRFDFRLAGRLYRAMKSGRVVKVPVWVIGEDGRYVIAGDHLLSELLKVKVFPWIG